jgi:predicted nucleic acid-binding protein
MLIVLSPAKSLDLDTPPTTDHRTTPQFIDRAAELIRVVAPDSRAIRLPVCTDRDDQKFLEIARDAGAAILVTKDKALLKLAKKTAREGLFRIMTPELWTRDAAQAALE